MNVVDIEGIGPERAERLATAGIRTTDDLLRQGGTVGGRKELAATTGFSTSLILEWVNRADLARIDGVGSEYADLLEAAGVDSPLELAQRNPTNLAAKFREIDAASPNIVRRVPGEATVAAWVAQAKTLQRMVWHDNTGQGSSMASPVASTATPPATERPTTQAEPAMSTAPEPEPAAAPAMSMAAASDTAMSDGGRTATAMVDEAPGAMAAPAPAVSAPTASTSAASMSAPASSESAAAMAPRSGSTGSSRPAPLMPQPAPTHRQEGIWVRIRKMLGLG
jgi:predicted flap endonuclease-1-like 5' DNA nuclease